MTLDECLTYQKALRTIEIGHRNFTATLDLSFTLASFKAPQTVIMIVGPSKVGKSTVLRYLHQRLTERSAVHRDNDYTMLVVEGTNAVGGFFSTKHFTLDVLSKLRHPIFGSYSLDTDSYRPRLRAGEPDLRLALEKAIVHRKTHYLAVDEAHHLLYRTRGENVTNVLDSLKCLGNTTSVVVILCGGFRLLTQGLESAHFDGRLHVVPFMNYGYSRKDTPDTDEFGRILELLDKIMPVRPKQSLKDMQDFIHLECLGCVGLLIKWLERALATLASTSKVKHLSKSVLEDAAMLDRQRDEILADIEIGLPLLSRTQQCDMEGYEARSRELKGRHVSPFQRKPVRDPVG
ncbi:MAG TPA: ATP-binding protein [Gammaproteobacteria bacterium]|jgi:hypothetical protein